MPHLRLLGTAELAVQGRVVAVDRKPLLVLAALAISPDHRRHRDDIVRLLWPDRTVPAGRSSLRQARYQLKSWCEVDCIRSEGETLALAPDITTDLDRLEAAVGRADHAAALSEYTGHLLDSMIRELPRHFAREVEAYDARVRSLVTGVLDVASTGHLRAGAYEDALPLAMQWATMEPLQERPQVVLVEALVGVGDAGHAIAAFESYRALVAAESGDRPTEAFSARIEELRALAGGGPVVVTPMEEASADTPSSGGRTAITAVVGAIAVAGALLLLSRSGAPGEEWIVHGAVEDYDHGRVVETAGTPGRGRELGTLTVPESFHPVGSRRLHDGSVLRFGRFDHPADAPRAAVLDSDGSWVLAMPPGVQTGIADVSPRGDAAIVFEELPLEGEDFREHLVLIPFDDPENRTELMTARSRIPYATWSHEALAIAAVVRAPVDTVLFLSPTGAELGRLADDAFPSLGRIRWCPSGEFVVTRATGVDGLQHTVRAVVPGGSFEPAEDSIAYGQVLACLDATADSWYVAGFRRQHPEAQFVAVRASTGERRVLEEREGSLIDLFDGWLPDEAPAAATRLSVRGDREVEMPWGERMPLVADLLFSDGAALPAGSVTWTSSAPGVARIVGDEILAAGPGRARLVASLADLSDSVEVRVTGTSGPNLLVEDVFDGDWESRWYLEGAYPRPTRVYDSASESYRLSLNGDGRYVDRLVLKEPLDLRLGAIAEMDFRIEINRTNHQRFGLCLVGSTTGFTWGIGRPHPSACIVYPLGELEKLRADRAYVAVTVPGMPQPFPVDLADDPDRWHHVALGIAPDGTVTATIDGSEGVTAEWSLDLSAASTWYVEIMGWSRDGRTEVGNLRVRRPELR